MREQMTREIADQILAQFRDVANANIFDDSTQVPFKQQAVVLALDTAKLDTAPFEVKFPFRSVWVQDATDTSVYVNIRMGSRDSFQSSFKLHKNDVYVSQKPITQAFIDWSAQSGKSITLIFFVDAEFRSGSLINTINGGVTIQEGTANNGISSVNLSATTAAAIAPALSTRLTCTIQNQTGADLWIGDSAVTDSGATQGIKIAADERFVWRNTAALYGYSVLGGRVNRLEEA